MKRMTSLVLFVVCLATLSQAQVNWSFKGTVTKMRMTDCVPQRGFMASMAGGQPQAGVCPEYTVVGDKVVYVVTGKRTDEFMPLAENIQFIVHKNELTFLSDDEKTKSRFSIQQMTLRGDWEREEAHKEAATRILERTAGYETRTPPRAGIVSASGR